MVARESDSEKLARHLVSSVLRVPVRWHDDGSQQSMVDAMIEYPDRLGALEIIGDHDEAFASMASLLAKQDHFNFDSLKGSWQVWIQHDTKVKDLRPRLGDLLAALEAAGQHRYPPRSGRSAVRGVDSAHLVDGEAGLVRLRPAGWSSAPPPEGEETEDIDPPTWTETVLRRQSDVARKLGMVSGVSERHAFIWVTIGSDYGLQFQLMRDDESPSWRAPDLPDGITHLWLGGSGSSLGTYAWFPQRGWWRTPWRGPRNYDELQAALRDEAI